MDMLDGETEVRDYNLERLMMLSDGVFAIAMTLLALDLRPPANWNHQLASLFAQLARPLVAYALSVFMIGVYWVRHRRTFGRIVRADMGLTIFNFVVLALITLVPAAASLIPQSGGKAAGEFVLLGLLAIIGFASGLQWIYAAFMADLVKPSVSHQSRLVDTVLQLAAPVLMLALAVVETSDMSLMVAAPIAVAVLLSFRVLRGWARRIEQAEARTTNSLRKEKATA
jgi:uncharacterized membrane protein